MFFAKLITLDTIDEITDLNGGVRPADETMDNHTFFVYSEASDDTPAEILTRAEFRKKFRWQDLNSTDNVVVHR